MAQSVDDERIAQERLVGRGRYPKPVTSQAQTAEEVRRALDGTTIWLWHYMHADWQWEQSREWHEERYALAVEEVLDLMQGDSGITYFFDTASEFYEPVARLLGARVEELHARIREGRIRIVSAQVANARPNLVAEETYIRNMQIGRAFFERNVPPTEISLFHSVDIAIGHSQMPQLLTLAGFDAYRAWRPHGPMNALGIPHQFVWEGLDGSRIMVTRGAYGGFYTRAQTPFDFESDWDAAVLQFHNYALGDQLIHDRSASGQLWAIQGCDDSRPFRTWEADTFFDLPAFVARWNERETAPIRWCSPVEFSAAVAGHLADLPVVSGVLDGCDCSYNAGNSGQLGLWAWRTRNDRRLLRAERWAAIATQLGAPDQADELTRLWGQHCVYQAHAEEFAFDADFEHLVDLAQEVRLATDRITGSSLQVIAGAAGGGDRLTRHVFNQQPWPVDVDVEVYHAPAVAGVETLTFTDVDGQILPAQVLERFRHPRYGGSINDQRTLVRLSLPALGYRTVHIAESSATPEDLPGATPGGGLRVTTTGHLVTAITDRTSGRELRGDNGGAAITLAFHELDNQNWLSMGPEVGRHAFAPVSSRWVEEGPLRWRHRSEGRVGPYDARVDVIVPDHGNELRVEVRLEGHWHLPPMTGWVSLMMPTPAGARLTVDVPFGVETRDPDTDVYVDNVPEGEDLGIVSMFERLRPGWFWARSWCDASAAGAGVAAIGINGNFFWQKEGDRVGPVLMRAMQRTPGTWEERTAQSMTGSGVHEFAYAIRLHDGQAPIAALQARSAELHHEPVVVRANHPAPALLPAAHSFLHSEGPAQVSAVYLDGGDLVVRLYEHTGEGGEAVVHLDREVEAAVLVDLTGAVLAQQPEVRGRDVAIELSPWQIATLRIAGGRNQ